MYSLKSLFAILFFSLVMSIITIAQVSVRMSVGYSKTIQPHTRGISIYPHEGPIEITQPTIFNVQYHQRHPLVGVALRYDFAPFYFMSELWSERLETKWTVEYPESNLATQSYMMKDVSLSLPVSLGVNLGGVEVFSGGGISYFKEFENGLRQMENYERHIKANFSFHTGVGVPMGKWNVQVRYQQILKNYGQYEYLGDHHLLLLNAPQHWMFSVSVRM